MKRRLKIITAMVLMIVCGFMGYTNKNVYLGLQNPFEKSATFSSLYAATIVNGYIYRIDRSRKRITKTHMAGDKEIVDFVLDLSRTDEKERAWYERLEVGDDDTLYVKKMTMLKYLEKYRVEIFRYSTDSVFPIGKKLYTFEKDSPVEQILELKKCKYGLRFTRYENNVLKEGANKITICRIEPGKKEPVIDRTLNIPDAYKVHKVTYDYNDIDPRVFYISTKKGEILRCNAENKDNTYVTNDPRIKKIYLRAYSNPVFMQMNKEQLIFADEFQRSIRSLDLKSNTISDLLTEEEFKAKARVADESVNEKFNFKTGEFPIKSSFAFNEGLRCISEQKSGGVSCGIVSIISDHVTYIDLDKPEVQVKGLMASYKPGYILQRMSAWLILLVFIVSLVYLIVLLYKGIIRRRIVRKQTFWAFAAICVTFAIISLMLKQQIYLIITNEVKRELVSKVNIGVELLDKKEFHYIRSTNDFGGKSYNKLLDFIKGVQGNDPNQSAVVEAVDNSNISGNSRKPSFPMSVLCKARNGLIDFIKPAVSKPEYISNLYKVEKAENQNLLFSFCVMSDQWRSPFHPYLISEDDDWRSYNYAANNDKVVFFETDTDTTGAYMQCIRRFESSNNEIGLYEIAVNKWLVNQYVENAVVKLMLVLLAALIVCCFGITLVTKRLLAPLGMMKDGVKKLYAGDWLDDKFKIGTRDEMREIFILSKRMSNKLKKTQEGYARFVPQEINKLIDKNGKYKNIYEIKLENFRRMKAGVMVTGIRSFYSLTGKMDEKDKDGEAAKDLEFIKEHHKEIGPLITSPDYAGFIVKFMGNGVMALYPKVSQTDGHRYTDNILKSALAIQKRRVENNKKARQNRQTENNAVKNYIIYDIGIGLNVCNDMILGIVGFSNTGEHKYYETDSVDLKVSGLETAAHNNQSGLSGKPQEQNSVAGKAEPILDRLDIAAIDKGVVLSEVLMKYSKDLGASILATGAVIENLEDKKKYKHRRLGKFAFVSLYKDTPDENNTWGKEDEYDIYDVYQSDEEEQVKLKDYTKEKFEAAVGFYKERKFTDAKTMFLDIICINNMDEAARIYYNLCDEYERKKPEDWSEVIRL